MVERSKAGTVYDRSNIGIAGSNPGSGMDVCPRVSVLCCPVSVEALRRADPPSKESHQDVSIRKSRKPIRVGQRSAKDCKCLLKKISLENGNIIFIRLSKYSGQRTAPLIVRAVVYILRCLSILFAAPRTKLYITSTRAAHSYDVAIGHSTSLVSLSTFRMLSLTIAIHMVLLVPVLLNCCLN
jgi:hypothetical protein